MNTCYISICKCFQKMKMDLQCEKAGQQLPVDGTMGTEARGHQGVTEPRGTRRTWGNRCAHRLGHSDGFRCVCACVCQIHETAPLNVCIYSNKAIQMVIRYGIFQYVTELQCT